MAGKIPPEAYAYYLGLGAGRSYEAVASHFGVTKKAVTMRAIKEGWQRRLAESEQKVRVTAEQKVIESRASINEKHLRIVRLVQAKAIEALKSMPISSTRDAVHAIEMSLREERHLVSEKEANAPAPASITTTAMFKKWFDASPLWQSQICASAAHWGEKAKKTERLILNLVTDICRWLSDLGAQGKIQGHLPLHELLLEAIEKESDEYKNSEMRIKVCLLDQELAKQAREDGIREESTHQWRTGGLKQPGDGFADTRTWAEFYPECGATSPIAYVAAQLRGTPAGSNGAALVPAAEPRPPGG
jgi:hypothetical protein